VEFNHEEFYLFLIENPFKLHQRNIVLAITYFININPLKQYKKRHQDTLDKLSDTDLLNIDQELNRQSTTCFIKQKLYITSDYLISKVSGLDIIRLKDIVHVYARMLLC